ncbi:MAG: phage major capsid protein [Eubacterium sp.]
MSFDNLKLEKGLYATGKSFTQALEELDPSENYIGTELEGLDAYQRQLKRFDIKVSGIGSDTVSKFFATTDSSALFPEYVSRAVRQGLDESYLLDKIIATTTMIDSLDYRAIESIPAEEDKELSEVAEGAYIPETVIKTKETLTPLKKRGRMLVASYEALKYQKLDLFTITLKQIGSYIAERQLVDAIFAIYDDDIERISAAGSTITYNDLVDLWNSFEPYQLTTILTGRDYAAQILKLDEFRDANAGLDFHGTGKMITPFGAELVKTHILDNTFVLGLDKSCAVEKVQAGDIVTDYDKLIDRQLERATITTIAGFSKIFNDASKILELS